MSEQEKVTGFGAGLLVGAAIGLVLGVLYAPRPGKETRALIMEKAEETKDKAEELIEEARKRAKKIIDEAKEKAAELGKKVRGEEAA